MILSIKIGLKLSAQKLLKKIIIIVRSSLSGKLIFISPPVHWRLILRVQTAICILQLCALFFRLLHFRLNRKLFILKNKTFFYNTRLQPLPRPLQHTLTTLNAHFLQASGFTRSVAEDGFVPPHQIVPLRLRVTNGVSNAFMILLILLHLLEFGLTRLSTLAKHAAHLAKEAVVAAFEPRLIVRIQIILNILGQKIENLFFFLYAEMHVVSPAFRIS